MSDKENSCVPQKRQVARKSTAKACFKRHLETIQNQSLSDENLTQEATNQRSSKKICLENSTRNSFSILKKP